MQCTNCGSENPTQNRFCDECGHPLAVICPACGSPSPAGKRFCGQCGTGLTQDAAPVAGVAALEHSAIPVAGQSADGAATPAAGQAARSELRWVSVLFVDLVGYTARTESWDAEDVRELLSGYFEVARTVVGRYGGTVEKFIGDAVMAVWGAPQAREDDAERAVRAGLEVAAAVEDYGHSRGLPDLRARAGVVTGQVASWANPGEGLVAGDRVNTAARVQSVAEPGAVLVDEPTRTASQAAIGYTSAGEHTVKGKSDPLVLWRATRVVAGAGGSQRVDGLEAGFIGRSRELALVKELFHATAEGNRARLVLVTGAAGVGKSRVGWEFRKYIEGLVTTAWWHEGRCLSYGDGVAFWALAQMVRQRFGVAEEDTSEVATARLIEQLPTWMSDGEEHRFVLPRLGQLIGAQNTELSRQELFAGWRLFFERVAAAGPVVMVVEDLQWADAGLLDFIDYLLEWSTDYPIFLLGFARPELAERRTGWLADRRNATTLHLDPLNSDGIEKLLDDLVPGMPQPAKTQIAARAEGVPLYAVETIRSLVDRDVVIPQEGVYRLVGEIGDLQVPATLTSLLAARLDNLPSAERDLVKGLAVLGSTFPRQAVAAVTDLSADDADELLRTLVRKEILTVRSDPLSPERGQYGFTQTMLRSVAYDTLTKRERKTRHLAAAEHLRTTFPHDGEEVAEVVATHYHDAYTAAPNDPDANSIRQQAVTAYTRAGARAGGLGAPDTAENAYQQAAALTTTEPDRIQLTESAADMALQAGRTEDALTLYQTAHTAHTTAGQGPDAARLAGRIGECLSHTGHGNKAIHVMESALDALADRSDDPILAELHDQLGTSLFFIGNREAALPRIEQAVTLATAMELPKVLSHSLNIKALLLSALGRTVEAVALLKAAAELAREHDLTNSESAARTNLGFLLASNDLPGSIEQLERLLCSLIVDSATPPVRPSTCLTSPVRI